MISSREGSRAEEKTSRHSIRLAIGGVQRAPIRARTPPPISAARSKIRNAVIAAWPPVRARARPSSAPRPTSPGEGRAGAAIARKSSRAGARKDPRPEARGF
jgi:hypothetical protein